MQSSAICRCQLIKRAEARDRLELPNCNKVDAYVIHAAQRALRSTARLSTDSSLATRNSERHLPDLDF